VLGLGDYASNRRGLQPTIDALARIEAPTFLLPGNNETRDALWQACAGWKSARVLHGEAATIGGNTIFGLGGGIPPTPLPWSFDIDEERAAIALERCPQGALLAVHSPPRGHVDRALGRHLGSRSILAAVERLQPPLVLCGHIHQAWEQESTIGATRVVNVGPRGMTFDV